MNLDRIIVVGASAGGVEPLRRVVAGLQPDLAAAVLVVLHLKADAFSALPAILDRAGPLPGVHAEDHEPIAPGRIYVAPPDAHMTVRDGCLRLVHGPTENGHRPAIDPLFRTAAAVYGERVIGVVLSGVLDDGTAGLAEVARAGGLTIVQSPSDALYPAMPRNALRRVDVDFAVPSNEIGPLLTRLVAETGEGGPSASDPDPATQPRRADAVERAVDRDLSAVGQTRGPASGLTCPECHGALWEVSEAGIAKFRCRVGHAWTEVGLLTEQATTLELALWTALRVLGERADLARRIRDRASERGQERSAKMFDARLDEFDADARLLREVLARPELLALDERLKELAQFGGGEETLSRAEPSGDRGCS
jgi:two-component system, chemotaxis family, protein-glutamate methylesterase/glutaminase